MVGCLFYYVVIYINMWSVKNILDLMEKNEFLYYIKKFKIEEKIDVMDF